PASTMTAAVRARTFDSMGDHPPLVEHLHGLRLVALRRAEKPIELFARLSLISSAARPSEAIGTRLRRNQCGQIDELSGLQRDELIARLNRLQSADGRLARGDEGLGLGTRSVQVLHGTCLDSQRILIGGE